jgi:hypothetical protein
MALTFTVGAGLVAAKNELDTHQLITAAIGCNVAWGLIDDAPCARQPVLSQSTKRDSTVSHRWRIFSGALLSPA